MSIRVLLTGGGGAGNEAIYRLLGDRFELFFADVNPERISPVIPLARRCRIPHAMDRSFLSSIQNLCADLDIGLLVPGVDEELPRLATAEFSSTPVFLPSARFVDLMLDKWESMRALEAAGIEVPTTCIYPSHMNFPAILKPRFGRGSRDVYRAMSGIQLRAQFQSTGRPESDFVVQELVEGVEYTVLVCGDSHGHLGAVVPVRVEEKKGVTIEGVTERRPDIEALCERIHQAFPTSGPYNVQLMATADGRLAVFEVNPRVSTTFCLCVAAGVDPYTLFLRGVRGGVRSVFQEGVRLRRSWHNEFSVTSSAHPGKFQGPGDEKNRA